MTKKKGNAHTRERKEQRRRQKLKEKEEDNAAIRGRKLVRRKTVVEEFATDSESDSTSASPRRPRSAESQGEACNSGRTRSPARLATAE